MISKAQFIAKLQNEVRILKHLASKATTPELLNFRFSDKQRSTAEWLAYLANIGLAGTKDIILDDGSVWASFNADYENFDIANFEKILDANVTEMITILEGASDEKLAEQKTLFGTFTNTRAAHMMGAYDWYVAYKTQVFLQLKAAGLTELTTMNLWAGADMPPATADGEDA